MLQFHLEVICNFITCSAYLVFAIVCLIQAHRHSSIPLLIFATFLFGFTLGVAFQALSYMLILETPELALNLKLAAGILVGGFIIMWFVWTEYVQFERVRPLAVMPICIVAVLLTNALLTTEALRVYTYVENGVVLGTSIGKVGLAHTWDIFSQGLFIIALGWYFSRLWRHAPPKLKPTAKFLTIFIFIEIFAGLSMVFYVRSLPDNGLAMVLTSLSNLNYAAMVCVLILVIIRVPQLLYVLRFEVSRLLVIHGESGIGLFDYRFNEHPVDGTLFSGLLQGLQQVSMEVLKRGTLREIRLNEGVLILSKYPRFTLGLLTSQSSQFLAKCLDQFARAFDVRFKAQVENFSGNMADFADAEKLVDKFFAYIPRNVQSSPES